MNNNMIYNCSSKDSSLSMPRLMGPLSIGVEGILVVDPITGEINTRY